MYPEFGHIGFKLFCGFCAYVGFSHSREHYEQKTQMNRTLTRIANALEKK